MKRMHNSDLTSRSLRQYIACESVMASILMCMGGGVTRLFPTSYIAFRHYLPYSRFGTKSGTVFL